ncbi:MAG: AbrB/MazE/SpoVT family DNA-binding domain-containing protein [Acidobacteria bacterium]|nr:AbrB/MazE/SpoVT family DNA-binding domain-containing protein [Acidobacteriota bacterium]
METVTLSSKFQIMIPKGVREQLQLKPGERFHVIGFGDRVELVPVRPIKEMRGILKGRGIETDIEREDDRL